MTTLIEKVWKRNLLQLVKIRFIYKLTMKKSSEKEMENTALGNVTTFTLS